jgi:hypothetical protein
MTNDIPEDTVLPCGCINTMHMIACKAGCTNVANALQEADDRGKPAEVRII